MVPDRAVSITARLLQAFYALHRVGAVMLTRAPKSILGGEHFLVREGRPDEARPFTDAAEAERFIRTALEEGDVVGIAWAPDEIDEYRRLQVFGQLLAESPTVNALILGPKVRAVQFRRDNLRHVAEVLGTASLLGVQVFLEDEVA